MRANRAWMVCALLVVAFFAVRPVEAASTVGEIEGTVLDSSGAPIPGATVTVTSDFGSKTTTSDKAGAYRVPGLAAGDYRVRAEIAGMQAAERVVHVGPGGRTVVNFVLSVGGMEETIEVTAVAPNVSRNYAMARSGKGKQAAAPSFPEAWRFPSADFNTASFSKLDENPFLKPKDEPRSTFSVDVDTASYAIVRSMLNSGQLPPKDAVRIEELLNYFRYDYPDPQDGRPFSISAEVGECPWKPDHRLVHIGLQAKRPEAGLTPPRNLVFLLDVSGSMQPANRLPLVRSAMGLLVDQLTAQDSVAIVVYAGASGLVLDATKGSQHEEIRAALERLQAGGSTNGAAGIQLAYDVAARHFLQGGVNRVILATDGDFNVGVASPGALVELIEEKRKSGVFLSVLGVGDDNLKDSTMEQLADKGNGNYAYLDSLEEAHKVLVRESGATLVTVAKDVKLQVQFNPARVSAYRLIGYENRALRPEDFKDDKKDAGEIGAGHSVTALYEIVPAGGKTSLPELDPLRYQEPGRLSERARSDELLSLALRYKRPERDQSEPLDVVVRDTGGAALSRNLGFAAAVAEFGLLLRDSKHKGQASFAQVRELAERHRGDDPEGYRAQFVRLVDLAANLSRSRAARRD